MLIRLPNYLRVNTHRAAWLSAAGGTLVMATWFVLTLDAAALVATLATLSLPPILLAVTCLMSCAVLDMRWLIIVVASEAARAQASRVVAWHVLLIALLPSRLGDLGWMYFMHTWLGLPPGRAVFIGLYHRLQDFLVVTLLFVLALGATTMAWATAGFVSIAVGVFVLLLVTCSHLDLLLSLSARALLAVHRFWRRGRLLRYLLRQVLGVRRWYQHALTRRQVLASFAIALVRWCLIIIAIATLIHGVPDAIDMIDSALLANLYIYLSIVPIGAIGGFGASEAGLAWALQGYGVELARASAFAFVLRVLLNLVHIALWATVLGFRYVRDRL